MFNPREHSQPITLYAFLFIACLLLDGVASAAPSISLSKSSGPPTSGILVSGRGFTPNVGVDIYFDTKDEALVVTNGEGEFDDAGIHVPRSAHPGKHWVTALERNGFTALGVRVLENLKLEARRFFQMYAVEAAVRTRFVLLPHLT